jgi:hypothetical protein
MTTETVAEGILEWNYKLAEWTIDGNPVSSLYYSPFHCIFFGGKRVKITVELVEETE